MRIDGHVHSYPTLIPGGIPLFVPKISGVKLDNLEYILRVRQEKTGEKHGVFYGRHDPEIFHEIPTDPYLLERVLPFVENHVIQVIGVSSWDNLDPLKKLYGAKNQIEGINIMANSGGLAIIDQPRPIYEKKVESDSVFLNHKGEATVGELLDLSPNAKNRTLLCYNGMLFPKNRKNAEKLNEATGIKLIGGSDTILWGSSLFSTYNTSSARDIREILYAPELIGELHKGALPWDPYRGLERIQRCAAGAIEEWGLGLEKRERKYAKMLEDLKTPNP